MPLQHPPTSHHILYAGCDRALPDRLNKRLVDCWTVRCPDAASARMFLRSDLRYTALLIDAQLPDATGAEVVRFARTLEHRRRTPIGIVPAGELDVDWLVGRAACLLATPGREP